MDKKDIYNSEDQLADTYLKKFNGEDYAEGFYRGDLDAETMFLLKEYFNYFSKELKKNDSDHQLLDFACGPVPIYAATAPAASFTTTITMCDLVENNRNMITKFMEATDIALIWKQHFNYMEKLSNKRSSLIVSDLRAAFKEVVGGDVHNALPIPGKNNYFDVIITNMSLEYASVNSNLMKKDLKNLGNMLKPGGILMEGGALGIISFSIKEENFPAVSLTTDIIKEMFNDPDTGMQLLVYKTLNIKCPKGHDGAFFLVAQKMGKDVSKKDLIEEYLEPDQFQ